MSYRRVVNRNGLHGDYDTNDPNPLIAGDLRRMEQDQRDQAQLEKYAKVAGITPEQAKLVLDAFLEGWFA